MPTEIPSNATEVPDPVQVQGEEEMALDLLRLPGEVPHPPLYEQLGWPLTMSHIYQELKSTDMKYRNRVRSRISNLKDPRNPGLRRNVLSGAISTGLIAKMTAEVRARLGSLHSGVGGQAPPALSKCERQWLVTP